jgi:hypothetical protein
MYKILDEFNINLVRFPFMLVCSFVCHSVAFAKFSDCERTQFAHSCIDLL